MPNWEQPLVSVDVVAIRHVDGELRYAVHDRLLEPFAGRAALPGVLLLKGESLADAAKRAVTGKLGIPEAGIAAITQFGAFDGTNRDPRGATISLGHIAVLQPGTGDGDADWTPLGGASIGLPFDHDLIAAAAASEVARRLWTDWELTRALLGDPFTTSEAIAITRQVGGRLPAPETNLSRWLKAREGVIKVGLRGRDTVWEWTK